MRLSRTMVLACLVLGSVSGAGLLSAREALAGTGHALAATVGARVDKTTGADVCVVSSGDQCGPGEASSREGTFTGPAGVAVDEVAGANEGDVYVVDEGNNRVERFTAAGAYLGEFNGSGLLAGEGAGAPTGQLAPPAQTPEHGTVDNIAIDDDPSSPSAGDVYVVDPGHAVIDKFSATGKYLSQLTGFPSAVYGVAVDSAGNVWVAEEDKEVREFDGSLENKLIMGPLALEFGRSPGIAIDSEDNIYLVRANPFVVKFGKAGEVLDAEATSCSCTTGIAFDESASNLYVDQGTSVARYRPVGESPWQPTEIFGDEGQLAGGTGIAVDDATGSVYVADTTNNALDIFSLITLPDVSTGGPANLQSRSVTLTGIVNPDGVPARDYFEYGTSPTLGSFSPSLPGNEAGAGTEPEEVRADLSGLMPNTTYFYRVVGSNAKGHVPGAVLELHTPPGPPLVTSGSAVGISALSASVVGATNPSGVETTYYYEYGTTTAYGQSTPMASAGAGTSSAETLATLSDLSASTSYHYRLVAINDIGTSYGQDETFETPPGVVPTAVTGGTGDVLAAGATISGTIGTQGLPTNYGFQLGTTIGSYGPVTGFANIASGLGEVTVSLVLQNLQPGTTYHYRVVAENLYGTSIGEDQAFTTPNVLSSLSQPPAAPLIATPALAFPIQPGANAPATTKALTRAQKLARALRACAKKPKRQRAGCERQARKSYGTATKKRSAKK